MSFSIFVLHLQECWLNRLSALELWDNDVQPRYVVNRVTAGDYNCPKEVSTFLGDLYTAFRTLNLRNDHLRKRFDGMARFTSR